MLQVPSPTSHRSLPPAVSLGGTPYTHSECFNVALLLGAKTPVLTHNGIDSSILSFFFVGMLVHVYVESPAACGHRANLRLSAIPGLEHDSFVDDSCVVVQPSRQAHVELDVMQALHVAQQVEEGGELCEGLLGCRHLGKGICL